MNILLADSISDGEYLEGRAREAFRNLRRDFDRTSNDGRSFMISFHAAVSRAMPVFSDHRHDRTELYADIYGGISERLRELLKEENLRRRTLPLPTEHLPRRGKPLIPITAALSLPTAILGQKLPTPLASETPPLPAQLKETPLLMNDILEAARPPWIKTQQRPWPHWKHKVYGRPGRRLQRR